MPQNDKKQHQNTAECSISQNATSERSIRATAKRSQQNAAKGFHVPCR